MPILCLTVLALLLASARGAAAQPQPLVFDDRPSSPAPERRARRWYGWQVLAADAVGLSLIGIGIHTKSSAASSLGIVAYWHGGPAVHLVHDQPGRAGVSYLLLRPAAGAAAVGVALSECGWGACASDRHPLPGVLTVLGLFSVVDALTGWESKVAPVVAPDGTRGLAISGTF